MDASRTEGLHALSQHFGSRLSTSLDVRRYHGEDGTHLHNGLLPDAVLSAQTTEDVVAALEFCNRYRIPVVPFGGGTSLEGQIAAVGGGLSIALTAMDAVLRVSREDMDCTVQAGLSRKNLNLYLRDTGLFFPVDACPEASIGGMASTRASGTNAMRYGTMLDNVLGLKAVLADGRVVTTGGRSRKSAAGYDLTRLMVGSAGTLAVVTEVTLRLHPIPEHTAVALATFPSLVEAVRAVTDIIQMGVPLAKVEILDAMQVEACNRMLRRNMAVAPTLFFEFAGSEQGVAEQVETTQALVEGNGGRDFNASADRAERERLWEFRHQAGWATMLLRPGSMGFATDVTVPISSLPTCIEETRYDLDTLPMPATIVGHVGDGNFHVVIPVDPESRDELRQVKEVNRRLVARALAAGGTCTGEHGVGIGKMEWMEEEFGATAIDVMRSIKTALDPQGIMNPGKIFSAQRVSRELELAH